MIYLAVLFMVFTIFLLGSLIGYFKGYNDGKKGLPKDHL